MLRVAGRLFTPTGFREATVAVDGGRVEEVRPGLEGDVAARGLLLPAFVNAHTHVGDAVVEEEPQGTLEELVAPPDGLKFRRLQEASKEDLERALRSTLQEMARTGISAFCDFREGGVAGARALRTALRGSAVQGTIMARPAGLAYDPEEVEHLLEEADGVAVSGISDWDYGSLEELARHVRRRGRPFALHASETRREDLDGILDLRPNFLVHMTAAAPEDWARCAQEDLPVVVCPRSQLFFGRVPDLPGMVAAGLRLALGTDNAMVARPSMLREMETTYRVARLRGHVSPAAILQMAYEGAKLISRPPPIHIQEGDPSRFLVLDLPLTGDVSYRAVQASAADISMVVLERRVWLRSGGWTEGT